jgi:hypothetical protein
LGALVFQKTLRRIGYERITRGRQARFGHGREAAAHRARESRSAELAHLMGIGAMVPLGAWMVLAGKPLALAFLVVWVILLQVYPILLQRYNRPRYRRVADRVARRASGRVGD